MVEATMRLLESALADNSNGRFICSLVLTTRYFRIRRLRRRRANSESVSDQEVHQICQMAPDQNLNIFAGSIGRESQRANGPG